MSDPDVDEPALESLEPAAGVELEPAGGEMAVTVDLEAGPPGFSNAVSRVRMVRPAITIGDKSRVASSTSPDPLALQSPLRESLHATSFFANGIATGRKQPVQLENAISMAVFCETIFFVPTRLRLTPSYLDVLCKRF